MAFPRTFVQIHYHDRPGGVSRVMAEYARAFDRCAGRGPTRTMILHGGVQCGSRCVDGVEHIAVPAFDYRRYRSARSFRSAREELVTATERLILDPRNPRPVCVAGHNMTLGKNLALTSAFSELAGRHGSRSDLRFHSVVHDLAEDGRADMLREIRTAASQGIDIWRALYPPRSYLGFVALNSDTAAALRAAGLAPVVLPNPVPSPSIVGPMSPRECTRLSKALVRLAVHDRTRFDPAKPTILYPARVISRKNPLEAVIMACLVADANLLLGAWGTRPADRTLSDRLLSLCRRAHLCVVADATRAVHQKPSTSATSPFETLYHYSDLCISTSVAEGFGYALYEPWAYGKPVVGRRPPGLAVQAGVDIDHLYTEFGVPSSWVETDALVDAYRRALVAAYGAKGMKTRVGRFERELRREWTTGGEVDFADLGRSDQFRVLERLLRTGGGLRDPAMARSAAAFHAQLRLFGGSAGEPTRTVEGNRRAVERFLGLKSFDRSFTAYFAGRPPRTARTVDRQALMRHFCTPERFRLLLASGA